jgi:hypothetical protein
MATTYVGPAGGLPATTTTAVPSSAAHGAAKGIHVGFGPMLHVIPVHAVAKLLEIFVPLVLCVGLFVAVVFLVRLRKGPRL